MAITNYGRGYFEHNLAKEPSDAARLLGTYANIITSGTALPEYSSKQLKKKEEPMNITAIAKRLLDRPTRTLVEAGFLDSELNLTGEGARELQALLFQDYKDQLVKAANEKIAEQKKGK